MERHVFTFAGPLHAAFPCAVDQYLLRIVPNDVGLVQVGVEAKLQGLGKPVQSAILSLARQIIFFVPAALILPKFLGVTGVLWTGPVADGLAFLLSLGLLIYERSQLKEDQVSA